MPLFRWPNFCNKNRIEDRWKSKSILILKLNKKNPVMAKFVLLLTLLGVFGGSLALDDIEFHIDGGLSDIGEEGLSKVASQVPIIFGLFSLKYPEFDYVMKRVVSGQSQVVAGHRVELKLEVTPKDSADQVKNCELDYVTNLQQELTSIGMKCDHCSKTYTYHKNL